MIDVKVSQLLELKREPAIVLRRGGVIVFANRLAANLLGYAPDELIGQPLATIILERCWDPYAECSASQRREASSISLWAFRKDGREVPVDIRLSPLKTDQGLLVVASLRDTSIQHEAGSDGRSTTVDEGHLRDRLAEEHLCNGEETQRADDYDEFVGRSRALQLVLKQIDQVAVTDANVLIFGETGTGKELVARAIHKHSRRKDHPLITVNCAALPSSLIESELFGHEAGAFTGALTRKIGRFELADEGTIFLDEIGELPIELQSKLLRVIQEGVFWRLGSASTTQVNVRVIAATNRDLRRAIEQNTFRSDLYFRLAVFPIDIPPLRSRREDVPRLVCHYVSRKQAKLGRRIEQISQATMDRLTEYAWPGNIRELENVLERAMILSPSSTLLVEPLRDALKPDLAAERHQIAPAAPSRVIDDVVREHIINVLQECHWQIKGAGAAAERLGMNPSTLRYRMKTLGIARP